MSKSISLRNYLFILSFSLWFGNAAAIFQIIEPFFMTPFEAPQRSVKIKIQINFFSSSGIATGRVKKITENVPFV